MKLIFRYISLIIIFILVFSVQSSAQLSLQVGGGLGYSLPTGSYGGSTIDFYNGSKYGIESGFNLHGKARLSILTLSVFGELGYTTFSGNGESEPGRGTVDVSHKIVSIKVGPELPLGLPMLPVTPYLQGFISFNSITGTVEFQGVADIPSGKYDLAGVSRIGFGAGAGVVFNLGSFKLDANLQYHALNVVGKEYKIEKVTSHARLDNYTSLNDARDPVSDLSTTGHFIKDDRGIGALEFKLSVLFGL